MVGMLVVLRLVLLLLLLLLLDALLELQSGRLGVVPWLAVLATVTEPGIVLLLVGYKSKY